MIFHELFIKIQFRVVTDTSSLVETDSTIGYQPSDSNNRKRSTQQQQAQNKPLPSNPVQVNIPNQHPQVQVHAKSYDVIIVT